MKDKIEAIQGNYLIKEVSDMKYGKYMFESFKEFQQILSLATANGVGTGEKFFNFLSENYSHKLIKSN